MKSAKFVFDKSSRDWSEDRHLNLGLARNMKEYLYWLSTIWKYYIPLEKVCKVLGIRCSRGNVYDAFMLNESERLFLVIDNESEYSEGRDDALFLSVYVDSWDEPSYSFM